MFSAFNLTLLLTVAYLIWAVSASVTLIMQRRSPVATLAWVMALLLLPYVGALVYMFFGPRKLYRKKLRYNVSRERIDAVVKKIEVLNLPESVSEDIRLRYRQIVSVAMRLNQPPPVRAESLAIYERGEDFYAAQEAALLEATHHIHLEYYIWAPGPVANRLLDILVQRARAGVRVKLLVDDVGSWSANERYFAPLVAADGEVAWFNPVRWSRLKLAYLNFRTHRKIAIIDGRVGFTGGMNISDSQSSTSSGGKAWRDTHLRIAGPPVAGLQRLFLQDWYFAAGECEILPEFFPPPELRDGPIVQIIASGPDETTYPIQRFMFAAITSARHSIRLTTPYFVPDEAILQALIAAALRGIEVKLLVPKRSDSLFVTAAARSYFSELTRVGVVIYEYGPPMLHSKTMVIDEGLSVIGTANLDNRSFKLNFEVIAAIYDQPTAQTLAAAFMRDLKNSSRYEIPHSKRRFWTRFAMGAARLASPVL